MQNQPIETNVFEDKLPTILNLSDKYAVDIVKIAESTNEAVLGKHENSTVVFHFNSDNKYIYATDADTLELDLFANCHHHGHFADVLAEHDLSLESLLGFFKSIFHEGYEFSNENETVSARLVDVFGITPAMCIQDAAKYSSLTDWVKNSPTYHHAAGIFEVLDQCHDKILLNKKFK